MSIVFDLERTNQLNPLPDKDLVDLCHPIEPYQVTKNQVYPGNYGRGPKGIDRKQTTPVGYFKVANAFGLYDMHGNVWEWCEDDYHPNYQGAPTNGSAWISKNKPTTKVVRGGSWYVSPDNCRSAYRNDLYRRGDDSTLGFRVVCGAGRTV